MLCPCHDHTATLNLQHQRLSKSRTGLQISLWMRSCASVWRCHSSPVPQEVPPSSVTGWRCRNAIWKRAKCRQLRGPFPCRFIPLASYPSRSFLFSLAHTWKGPHCGTASTTQKGIKIQHLPGESVPIAVMPHPRLHCPTAGHDPILHPGSHPGCRIPSHGSSAGHHLGSWHRSSPGCNEHPRNTQQTPQFSFSFPKVL